MANTLIYTRQLCGFCSAAKRLLDDKGVDYTEIDATFSPGKKQEMIAKSGGKSTFPQIFIGSTHVGGCDDLYALHRAGKLDALISAND